MCSGVGLVGGGRWDRGGYSDISPLAVYGLQRQVERESERTRERERERETERERESWHA